MNRSSRLRRLGATVFQRSYGGKRLCLLSSNVLQELLIRHQPAGGGLTGGFLPLGFQLGRGLSCSRLPFSLQPRGFGADRFLPLDLQRGLVRGEGGEGGARRPQGGGGEVGLLR